MARGSPLSALCNEEEKNGAITFGFQFAPRLLKAVLCTAHRTAVCLAVQQQLHSKAATAAAAAAAGRHLWLSSLCAPHTQVAVVEVCTANN